jgi:hypothetical protein
MKKASVRKLAPRHDDFLASVARKIGATLGAVAAKTADFSVVTPQPKVSKRSPIRRRKLRKSPKV